MDKPQGWVKVGCSEDADFWKLYVADNGPGIEQRFFERIFKLFQTLSPHDESGSTGVGLSLAKKIVEIYGGKIWIESEVGRGSTFFFTLPKQQAHVEEPKLQPAESVEINAPDTTTVPSD
jgi:signal transduction histidine kinase